jgi:hypothetical protein
MLCTLTTATADTANNQAFVTAVVISQWQVWLAAPIRHLLLKVWSGESSCQCPFSTILSIQHGRFSILPDEKSLNTTLEAASQSHPGCLPLVTPDKSL